MCFIKRTSRNFWPTRDNCFSAFTNHNLFSAVHWRTGTIIWWISSKLFWFWFWWRTGQNRSLLVGTSSQAKVQSPLHTNLFPQDYFSSPFIHFCPFDIVSCVATLGIDAGLLWEPSQRYKNMAKASSSTSITSINQLLDDFLWAVVPSLLIETLLNMSSSKLLWYSHHPHLLPKKWNTVKPFLTEKCLPASNLFQTRTSGEVGTLRHRIIVAWIFPELTIF